MGGRRGLRRVGFARTDPSRRGSTNPARHMDGRSSYGEESVGSAMPRLPSRTRPLCLHSRATAPGGLRRRELLEIDASGTRSTTIDDDTRLFALISGRFGIDLTKADRSQLSAKLH